MHLATKQIGKPGAGPLSLTGQPNAMGGREVGGMANLMSGHRDLANPQHREEIQKLWNVPSVPSTPGKTAVEMFQAAADGQIKVLWIVCTNPAQSMPDQAVVRKALERAELVIVQEAFATTATCAYADILLPATTWGEKEGTVTNTERRVSRVRPAVAAPGETQHDWSIAAEFSRRLEKLLPSKSPQTLFDYPTPESVWLEHRESTRGRDLDITGMSYALLEATPLQWPMKEGESIGKERLYEDNVFPTAGRQSKVRQHRLQTGGRAARIALPVFTDHGPPARPMARHEPHGHFRQTVWSCGRADSADECSGHDAPLDQRGRFGACDQQAWLDFAAGASV